MSLSCAISDNGGQVSVEGEGSASILTVSGLESARSSWVLPLDGTWVFPLDCSWFIYLFFFGGDLLITARTISESSK